MTASWLLQMGWVDVHTIACGPDFGAAGETDAVGLAQGVVASPQGFARVKPRAIWEKQKGKDKIEILDFGTSIEYRKGHIPGAAFAIRARLENHLELLRPADFIVCTSPDGVLAQYAAADLAALLGREVATLEGGTAAWREAGLPMEQGETRLLEPPEDVYTKPYDGTSQIEAAMQDYLQWELGLVEQIRRDPDCAFRDFA